MKWMVTVWADLSALTPPSSVHVAAFGQALLGPNDQRIEGSGGRARHLEDALEGGDDVLNGRPRVRPRT